MPETSGETGTEMAAQVSHPDSARPEAGPSGVASYDPASGESATSNEVCGTDGSPDVQMTGDACEPSRTGKIPDTGVRDATTVCGEETACQEVPQSLGLQR